MRASLPVLALLALAGCGTAEPTTAPPVVLPSHDPLPTASPTPSPTPAPSTEGNAEPHRIVGESMPHDPEVRAAMEAYLAYETAMSRVTRQGGNPEAADAALALTDDLNGRGNSESETLISIEDAKDDGPVDIYGVTRVRFIDVIDRRDDAVQLSVCVDNSDADSPAGPLRPYFTNTPWMIRNDQGEWMVYAFELIVVEEC